MARATRDSALEPLRHVGRVLLQGASDGIVKYMGPAYLSHWLSPFLLSLDTTLLPQQLLITGFLENRRR